MDRQTLICTDSTCQEIDEGKAYAADCRRCKALCCILLPFDADQGFAFDKAAAIPCPNLAGNFACSIHSSLAEHGFPGCVRFDCHGAGQYVTELLDLDDRWYECEGTVKEAYALFLTTRKRLADAGSR